MTRRVSPMIIYWALGGFLGNALAAIGDTSVPAQLIIAVLGLTHSIVGFWRDGGQRISAPGVFLFASALFVFFPAIYLVFDDPFVHGSLSPLLAVNVMYFSQLVLHHCFWEPRLARSDQQVRPATDAVANWGFWCGLALMSGGVALSVAALADPGLANAAAFSGIVLLSVATFRRDRRLSPLHYIVVALAFVAYLEFVFGGFGRLQIGALGIAIALAAAHRWPRRGVKLAILLAIGPTIAYLSRSRAQFTATLNPNQSPDVSGIESVVGPYIRFAELLQLNSVGDIAHTFGRSFFASAVALVPREIWPTKPLGFGAELAHFFRPELDGTGHSELALLSGEWLFAFGLIGLAAMVPLLGIAITGLDRAMATLFYGRIVSRRDLLLTVAVILLASSIVDLVWGGTFNYVARVGPRVLVVFVLFTIFAWRRTNANGMPLTETGPASTVGDGRTAPSPRY